MLGLYNQKTTEARLRLFFRGAGLYSSEVALKEYYGQLFYWVKSAIQIKLNPSSAGRPCPE
jgi:hypothetical protein